MLFPLFNCVILNLPLHNIAGHLGVFHSYCLITRKFLWRLVGICAMETAFLLDQLIRNG